MMGNDGKLKMRPTKGWRFYAAFASLCIINFVCALDATIVSVALPIIAKELHGTAIEAFWVGTSFLLTATVFQPSFASLSHIFGRKLMLLVALTFFTFGAALAALARNFSHLLVGRSVQGVGGGGISSLTYVTVTDLVTLKERGKWFGLITMMWAFGSVIGPVIGGAFAEKASWRWIFWINLPFCILSYITIPCFLRLKRKEGKVTSKLRQNDWIGSVLFVASTTSFLIPLTWGGITYNWNHWRTFVPLYVGVAGLGIFVLWSKFVSNEPILRGSMFKDGTALTAYFGTVVHGMFLWSALYYMPLYFEAAKGLSPTMSGVALFPWTFTTGPAAAVVGLIIGKTGRWRWGIWLGWFLAVVGIGLLVLFEASTPTGEWVAIAMVSGLGLGILYSAMSFAIQASSTDEDLPFTAALYSFFRNFGQMLGVAVGETIFQNQVKKNLLAYPEFKKDAVALSKDASALVEVIKEISIAEAATGAKLVAAYVDALRVVWITMAGLAGATFVLSIAFTKKKTLERELKTDQGFLYDGQDLSTCTAREVSAELTPQIAP